MSGRIAILFHEATSDDDTKHTMIYHISSNWIDQGYTVTYLKGVESFVGADILFLHVDLSVIPAKYIEFSSKYPIAVNAHVTDIRKSKISKNLVRFGDGWNGPVVVKNDLNFGGCPEHHLKPVRLRKTQLGRMVLGVSNKPPFIFSKPFDSSVDYCVFDSLASVPMRFRMDPSIVIERFLPEFESNQFHLRLYQFLEDRSVSHRVASGSPIVRAENRTLEQNFDPHPIVHLWRKEFQIDYGKFDYVVYKGKAFLLDINKGPGQSPNQIRIAGDFSRTESMRSLPKNRTEPRTNSLAAVSLKSQSQ